ncbi:papain fold toxin domain-containing protein [Rhodocytophaga aerolata]|uniref:Papain fold toxin domain-containing protein n=1 Tax=Rhodocytophaga aerolata TaxID=455078 RepID=A0ABT8RFF1_9BACT|nr:papain fold toxin domain-containing protein [Rhodocytophaga aerolata]MDO1450832.1 papain fold toxin domain-containing protein [Rhodocytophaga aerolata]
MVQENHYDPFGLNLAGIEKRGAPDDKHKFLSQEQLEEFGLGWVQTAFRSYDPQVGRFHQVDLLTVIIPSINPYQYAYNNPSTLADPSGLLPEDNDPSSRDPGGSSEDPGNGGGGDDSKKKKQQAAPAEPAFYEDAYWVEDGPGHQKMKKALEFFPPTAAVNAVSKYSTGHSVFDENDKADGLDYALDWLDIVPEVGTGVKMSIKIGAQYAIKTAPAWTTAIIVAMAKQGGKQTAQQIAAAVAKKYAKEFQCKLCAEAIVNALKKAGIKGQIIDITTPIHGKRGGYSIHSDRLGKNIATNGTHRAVLIDGKIYDNFNTDGIDYDTWIKDLYSPFGYKVDVTPF